MGLLGTLRTRRPQTSCTVAPRLPSLLSKANLRQLSVAKPTVSVVEPASMMALCHPALENAWWAASCTPRSRQRTHHSVRRLPAGGLHVWLHYQPQAVVPRGPTSRGAENVFSRVGHMDELLYVSWFVVVFQSSLLTPLRRCSGAVVA